MEGMGRGGEVVGKWMVKGGESLRDSVEGICEPQ